MATGEPGRRVAYDKVWGGLLAISCVLPMRAEEPRWLWQVLPATGEFPVSAWIVAGSLAGMVALGLGLAGLRSRWRHFLNFLLGVVALGLPLLAPGIWHAYPAANPAALPLGAAGAVGWVMLVGMVALYAGSGIRVVRPSQITGQAMGALGAFLLAVFAFLPTQGGPETSFAWTRLRLLVDWSAHGRSLLPFLLVTAAVACGTVNLLRSPREVLLAKMTRVLLVTAMLAWIALPLVDSARPAAGHLPTAWGALRFLGPLFLSLDGCLAFLAITITRTSE